MSALLGIAISIFPFLYSTGVSGGSGLASHEIDSVDDSWSLDYRCSCFSSSLRISGGKLSGRSNLGSRDADEPAEPPVGNAGGETTPGRLLPPAVPDEGGKLPPVANGVVVGGEVEVGEVEEGAIGVAAAGFAEKEPVGGKPGVGTAGGVNPGCE